MTNKVNFIMNNVPAGLDSMYVRVEESVVTQGVRNVLPLAQSLAVWLLTLSIRATS